MYNKHEYIHGKQTNAAYYNPRFCSTLPWTDHTEIQGSELQGVLNGMDGYNSNGCFTVHSYVGGKTQKQELVLFNLDDLLFTEPLILSVVCKKEEEYVNCIPSIVEPIGTFPSMVPYIL